MILYFIFVKNKMFKHVNTTPLSHLRNRDEKFISKAIENAENSLFSSSKRVGAVLICDGKCFLRGKPA